MRFGFQLSRYAVPELPRRLSELVRRLEGEGVDSFWLMDHLFQIEELGPAEEDMLEAFTTLGFLAGLTSRIELGVMVASVTFRPPGVLLKMAHSLDLLCGGRSWLGLGAGWYEREHRGLGIPFPRLSERFERLEEVLRILQQPERSFAGRHYQLQDPLFRPSRRPPVLVGGMGERRTLPLVARYADACNFFQGIGPAEIARKLEVLRGHCSEVGRDFATLQKTTLGVYRPGQKRAFLEELRALQALGVDTAVVGLLDPWDGAAVSELLAVLGYFRQSYSGP
ncbi:MAG: TIGR03560 family F420-dependent LLM class oxidoreductase [Candidatus Eremiobacteraeota bacterium]|nr:TIGR03560 family F420-dependent LLM class oxidoreductase [Candidatus Eremiobacteraeota bacterium]